MIRLLFTITITLLLAGCIASYLDSPERQVHRKAAEKCGSEEVLKIFWLGSKKKRALVICSGLEPGGVVGVR